MRESAASLTALAFAVLDRENVDWARARARADTGAASLVASLEVIDRIAQASRASRVARTGRTGVARRAGAVFSALLATLATGHVVAAAVGYAVGIAAPGPTTAGLAVTTMLMFAAAGAWLGLGGRADPRARNLGIFYLLIAAAFARRFLPGVSEEPLVTLLRAGCPDAFLAFFLWRFVGQFPRTVRFGPADRFCRHAERASLVAGLSLFVVTVLLGLHLTPWLRVLGRSHPAGLYWAVVLGLTMPALPVAWLRARSSLPEERRRLEIFTFGLVAGLAPMLADILVEVAFPDFRRQMVEHLRARALAFQICLLAVPSVTAYSVLVDQVLDVRMVVGRALRYLFARASLTVVAAVPFLVLGMIAYRHRDASLAQLASSGSGAAVAALAVAGLSLWVVRPAVLRAVDRRFLRDSADLSRDLPQFSADIRSAASRAELAAVVETHLGALLHVQRVIMLRRTSSSEAYIGVSGGASDLPARSALGELLAAAAGPLPVGSEQPGSCFALLPPHEQDWVSRVNAALLVPLVGSHNVPVGLLLAVARPHHAPYAREDLSFLATVAPAVALGLEVQDAREQDQVAPAAECPQCGRIGINVAERCACGSSRRQAPLPAVIAGKLRVDNRVGAGGMGVVYKGHDLSLNRTVALKTLTRVSPHAGASLGYEAQMMASVIHPHLATIYSLERWRGTPILVAEFLEGGTLSARLRKGPQSLVDVLQLGVALASALEHLHMNRVLHRDVKPSNIGFSGDGVPKLLDFGLASFLSGPPQGGSRPDQTGDAEPCATQSIAVGLGFVAGTPLYLSPEAASGYDTHADFDVWGLAIVLYEAIAGAHPFAAPTIPEVLAKVRSAVVPDLRRFRPDCPDPVACGFGLMLAPHRRDRPRTATALREMLQTLTRGNTPRT